MGLIFRKMRSEDLDVVKSIDKIAFPNPWPENAIKYELEENSNARLWVAELVEGNEKKLVAFAVIWVILDEAHIGTIAVHPDFQGNSVARRLLAVICLNLIDENINRLFLEVRKSNVAAIKLYEKFGFEVDGERKKYYRDNGEAALLMSCFLKSKIYYEEIFAKVADPISKQGKEVLS